MSYVKIAGKWLAIWIALTVGQIAGGLIGQVLVHPSLPAPPHDGPFDVMQALALINAAYAAVLCLQAPRLRGGLWLRALTMFGILYTVGTLLSLVEAIYFQAYVRLPMPILYLNAVADLGHDAMGAVAAALLWRGAEGPSERFGGLWWRIAVIIPIYIVVYFGAGALIAWQGAAVRAYYQQGMHIDNGQLALLQVFRGLVWATAAFLSVRQLTGAFWLRALITGVAFSVFMAAVLIVPNSFMPWAVARFHLAEIGISNLIFGFIAASILLGGRKTA